MAETVSFELRLIDSVSTASKRAADALRGVEGQANKAQKALDFSKELERAEQQLKRLEHDPKGYQKLIHAQKELAEQRKRLGKESFVEAFTEKLGFGKMATAAFFGDLLAEGMIEAIKKPIEMFAEGIKEAFKAGAQQEKLNLSYRLLFGKEGGKERLEDQERFAKQTRFTGSEIGQLMIPLFNSGMGDKAARQAFGTAADLEARTGRPIQEFVEMLAKINAKGGLTEKMLIGLGLNAKDFYTQLGKASNITAEEAKKRAESGKIHPQAIINQLTQSVNATQGGAAGTGGKLLSETMGARFEKLTKLPEEYFEKISDSPAWKRLSDRLGELLEKLSPESATGKKIIDALMRAFERLEGFIESALRPENIDKFAAGVETAVDFLGKLPEILSNVLHISEAIAAVWVATKIPSAVGGVVGTASKLGGALTGSAGLAGSAIPIVGAGMAGLAGGAALGNYLLQKADESDAAKLRGMDDETKRLKEIRDKKRAERGLTPAGLQNPGLEIVGLPGPAPGGRGTMVNAPVTIHVEHKGGEDHEEGARRAAQTYKRHLQGALDQASAEAGG